MDPLLKAAVGIPDIQQAEQSGGRSLLDPIGSAKPEYQKYTDVANIIHPVGGMDYASGKTLQEEEDEKRKKERGYKKGGAVKASHASRRGDGIAQRGKTRGRMV